MKKLLHFFGVVPTILISLIILAAIVFAVIPLPYHYERPVFIMEALTTLIQFILFLWGLFTIVWAIILQVRKKLQKKPSQQTAQPTLLFKRGFSLMGIAIALFILFSIELNILQYALTVGHKLPPIPQ